jgi:hypothetical protein
MLDRRMRLHRLKCLRERVEQHDCLRAAIDQLMLQLSRRIQRIDVHHHVTGTQNGCHGHRILQNIRQHHSDTRATRKTQPLKPRGKITRLRIQFAVGQLTAHADERARGRVRHETLPQHVANRAELRSVDLRRDTRRVGL